MLGAAAYPTACQAGEASAPVPMERLALVTDAWHPQINGVVHTLTRVVRHLESQGTRVLVIAPDGHRTLPLPSYPEIRLACDPWRALRRLREFSPQAIHIATEGSLGVAVRLWLARRGQRFTSAFHTRFPEYLRARLPVPLAWSYRFERWFHGLAECTLVGTRSLIRELEVRHVGRRLVHWPRGVDVGMFDPARRREDTYPFRRPIWLHVGRIAVEKRVEDFLALPLPGTKVVVGDGPAREALQRRFPRAIWRGWRLGDELATHFASADYFVFPSRTETFGNVLLEAMASGLPVAAVRAPGPVDVIEEGVNGSLDDDLLAACGRVRDCRPEHARRAALHYSWAASSECFRASLVPVVPSAA